MRWIWSGCMVLTRVTLFFITLGAGGNGVGGGGGGSTFGGAVVICVCLWHFLMFGIVWVATFC